MSTSLSEWYTLPVPSEGAAGRWASFSMSASSCAAQPVCVQDMCTHVVDDAASTRPAAEGTQAGASGEGIHAITTDTLI